MSEPTFLYCVGATKAGTSWLYRHLLTHPECRFRTVKELHWFTMTKPEHFTAARDRTATERARLVARLAGADTARADSLRLRIADLDAWMAVLEAGDLDAYRAFLTEGAGAARLVGDVTPAYALLPVPRLKALAQVARDVRVVFLMRDPVARLWSHVRMIAERTQPARFAEEARTLLSRILSGDLGGEGKGIVRRGDYADILPRLTRAFDPSRLLVMFTEDLMTRPGLDRLSAFLGLTPAPADLDKRVHEGQPLTLTSEERMAARRWLAPQYAYVSSHFPQLPAAWRANMEEGVA